MSGEKKTLDYMTNYRGFAILMIVMVHCVTAFLNKSNNSYSFIYYLFGHSTDLFLFISGFLFEFLSHKKYTYRTFIQKKIKRLIIPYLFWTLPVAFLIFISKDFDIKYLVSTVCTGMGHLNDAHWYIPFIFILFVISPIFTFLQKKHVLYTILLPVSLFVSLTSGRAEITEWYPIVMILNLLGFFILGMCFSHYRNHILGWLYKFDWALLLCGLFICIIASAFDFESPKPVLESINGYFHGEVTINWYALNRLFFCLGFICLFYRLDQKGLKFPMLEKLAHYSFAIYFCHAYIIKVVIHGMKIFNLVDGGVFYLLACFTLVLSFSIILIYILRRIKFTKKIIGV